MSWWLRDAARTRTRAQPGRGTGAGSSPTDRLASGFSPPTADAYTASISGDRSMVLTMRLDAVLEGRRQPVFSFEFFPPKTDDGVRQLFEAISHLRELEPTFVSVTYGAGGSVRTRTVDLVTRIRRELDIEPVAHLTCVDATVDDLCGILDALRDAGIDNVLALRGDPPEGDERFVATVGGLAHGNELMELITADYRFCVGGACYPEKHPGVGGCRRGRARRETQGGRGRQLPDHEPLLRQSRCTSTLSREPGLRA